MRSETRPQNFARQFLYRRNRQSEPSPEMSGAAATGRESSTVPFDDSHWQLGSFDCSADWFRKIFATDAKSPGSCDSERKINRGSAV